MVSCLLLIDVQNGFVTDNTKRVLPRIKQIIKANHFDHIAATRFMNTVDGPYVRIMDWNRFMDEDETKLIDFVDKSAEKVFKKSIYSAVNRELLKFAKDNSIDTFYLAGIDTDCCILKTAADMFEKNMDVRVLLYYSASNGGRKSFNAAVTVLNRLIGKNCIISGKYDPAESENAQKEADPASSAA